MHQVDIEIEHLWLVVEWECIVNRFVRASHVDGAHFRVPASVVHMIDPAPASDIRRCVKQNYDVEFSNLSTASMSSMRAWLPLVGTCVAEEMTSVLMVYCDSSSPMWGAVALVYHGHGCALWIGVEDSFERLAARYGNRPRRAADLVAWTRHAYATAPNLARGAWQSRATVADPIRERIDKSL